MTQHFSVVCQTSTIFIWRRRHSYVGLRNQWLGTFYLFDVVDRHETTSFSWELETSQNKAWLATFCVTFLYLYTENTLQDYFEYVQELKVSSIQCYVKTDFKISRNYNLPPNSPIKCGLFKQHLHYVHFCLYYYFVLNVKPFIFFQFV
jgi:hypothetical protein